jgi:hypothetical protein
VPQQKRLSRRGYKTGEGIDFVRCRICGDHRRVISGRHLSKHGIDREKYMQDYGLSPDELIARDFRRIRSSRRGFYPYGKKDWIVAIKKVYKRDGKVFAGHMQARCAYLYNQGVWIFGDWDKALRAAGFDPERVRIRSAWDKEKVIKGIRRLRQQKLPLYAYYVMKNHPRLFSGALAVYGSWTKALIACGITNKKQIPGKNRFGLLRDLRDTLEARGDISQALRSEVEYYFGSLRNAKTALKPTQMKRR